MNVNLTIEAPYVLGPTFAVFLGVAAVRHRRARPGWTGRHLVLRTTACLYAMAVLSITVFPWRSPGAGTPTRCRGRTRSTTCP
ncbi:hypothetical protein ACFQ3Z_34035 [Streptomyces nogalater]